MSGAAGGLKKAWRAEKKPDGKWWAVGPDYEFPVRRGLVEKVVASLNARSPAANALTGRPEANDFDVRQFDLRRLRQEAFDLDLCPNGPSEEGEWPCDPQVAYGGGWAECSVCGRTGKWLVSAQGGGSSGGR